MDRQVLSRITRILGVVTVLLCIALGNTGLYRAAPGGPHAYWATVVDLIGPHAWWGPDEGFPLHRLLRSNFVAAVVGVVIFAGTYFLLSFRWLLFGLLSVGVGFLLGRLGYQYNDFTWQDGRMVAPWAYWLLFTFFVCCALTLLIQFLPGRSQGCRWSRTSGWKEFSELLFVNVVFLLAVLLFVIDGTTWGILTFPFFAFLVDFWAFGELRRVKRRVLCSLYLLTAVGWLIPYVSLAVQLYLLD